MEKNNDELYHSDIYLGEDYSDGIRHWKYIKKEKASNGKWRYYYKNDKLDQLDKERAEAHIKAIKESNKYSSIGTVHKNGDTVHYQVERKDYSKEKENKALADYEKKFNKWALASIADVPRKTIAKGITFIANLFSGYSTTGQLKSKTHVAAYSTKDVNVKIMKQ